MRSGDTLSGIARQVAPEGGSLEQTLMGLFQANPDAFFGGNINQLRAGRILNVPEREQLAAIGQGQAAQQVRVHAANWHAYRRKLADAAPAVADAAPAAGKGRITARVEEPAAGAAPKDVVVLSKGDPGKAGQTQADRVRALEEDLAARDKALAEANSRVALLEKMLKDAQKLGEIKSQTMAGVQPPAKGPEAKAPEPKPEAKPAAKPEPKAEIAKVEPVKPAEPVAPEVKPEATAEPAKPAEKPEAQVQAPKPAEAPPKPVAVAPKKVAPPPPQQPSLMDTVMANILPIGGGAVALLGGAWWALRRRKKAAQTDDESIAPSFKDETFTGNVDDGVSAIGASAAATAAATAVSAAPDEPTVSSVTDVVDPIEEAQVYIDHGRDTQAEEILKEAMAANPERKDVQLKLLEIYAARGDKNEFNRLAGDLHRQTGGAGDFWKRAAVMGYAVDPTNPLYPATGEVVDLAAPRDGGGVDLDLGGAPSSDLGATQDILLEQGSNATDMEKTMVLTRESVTPPAEPAPAAVTDFNIELAPRSAPAAAPAAPTKPDDNMMEFNIDLPPASAPEAKPEPAPAVKADDGLDFKVDFSNINLNLDDAPASGAAAATGAKDAAWEDVQQKFDLARAYQEMGDKEGALEILREVEREGDAQQKADAQKMMQSLN
ncbi:MAG: hypothetical protein FJY56_19010 [Betaproteobacteria bacterium]|nr:hypothetical protein [Betaproteobacteria bacterium]